MVTDGVDEASDWGALDLTPGLGDHLATLGFERPTELQRAVLPAVLSQSNVVVEAPSGTGRTLAIGAMIVDLVADCDPGDSPVALVLSSSDARCQQLQSVIRRVGQQLTRSGESGIRSTVVTELGPIDAQSTALSKPLDVVIGTPRRIGELTRGESLDPATLEVLLVDQADDLAVGDECTALAQILDTVEPDRQRVVMASALLTPLQAVLDQSLTEATTPELPTAPLTRKPVQQSAYAVGSVSPETVTRLMTTLGLTSSVVLVRPQHIETYRSHFSQGPLSVSVASIDEAPSIESGASVIAAALPTSPTAYAALIEHIASAGGSELILCSRPSHRHLLRSFGRVAGIQLNAAPMPTDAGVEAGRTLRTEALLLQRLGKVSSQPTPRFLSTVQRLSSTYDVVDIASAAIALAHEALLAEVDSGSDIPLLLRQTSATPTEGDRRVVNSESSGPNRRKVADRRAKDLEPGMTRLFVAAGYNFGVRPGDIVGSFAGESGLSGKEIGNIDIRESFTLVEVPEALADDVISAMADGTIKGRQIEVRRERY